MPDYINTPAESKPAPFTLSPFQSKEHKHLAEWVTNALAGILPWRWDLGRRLGRTWWRNRGGYDQGQHSKERRAREARCAANVAFLERRHWYRACEDLPQRYKLSARALLLQARRLITDGDWWKPRSYVDPSTGEVKQTVYLPEDTWSAEAALDYCVTFLERRYASARGMAERVTPPYYRREAQTGERRGPTALKDSEWLAAMARAGAKVLGQQPELPATS